MSEELVPVKEYHFSAKGVRISFSREDPDELELVYKDEDGERRFSGRGIYRENTQLGFIASVVLEMVFDGGDTVLLSLAVPDANRPEPRESISVSTFAVRTTIRGSKRGPAWIEGQIQNHETIPLEGSAW